MIVHFWWHCMLGSMYMNVHVYPTLSNMMYMQYPATFACIIHSCKDTAISYLMFNGMYRKTAGSSRRWRKLDHTLEMLRYRKGNTGNLSRTVEARDNPWKGPRTAHEWSKHMSGFSLDVFCRVWLFVCFHQLHHVFFLIEAYPTAHHGCKNHRSSSQLKLGCKWILTVNSLIEFQK